MNQPLGFEEVNKSLLKNFNDNKLHHGLLFSGNKGIGKASFVIDLATQILLSHSSNLGSDLKKIQLGSHPDLLIITKEEKKRDIAVDAVRQINEFITLTTAISKYRVIIIDAIDDLNRHSNNAILKTLEEPPINVFLFLINHNSAKVLDTIKSRCHLIKIANPTYENFKNILIKNIDGIGEEEIKILAKISDNSIGSALGMYHYNAIDLYEQIGQLLVEENSKIIFDLSKTISGNEDLWNIFEKLIIFHLYTRCQSFFIVGKADKFFIVIDKITNLFFATKNLNLDKSQSVINIFNIIKSA